jgi:hypothetical protein
MRRPYAHAVAAARELCAGLGMRDWKDIDVEAVAVKAEIDCILPRPLGTCEGQLLRSRATGAALIAVREDLYGTRRANFVIPHEIGHKLLHAAHDVLPRCTSDLAGFTRAEKKIEGEASDAGCEIVMPEALFAPECAGAAPPLDALRDLSDRASMSLTATAMRALLFVEVPCAFVLVERGLVSWCACSEGWDVYIHRRAAVPEGTATAAVLRTGQQRVGGVRALGSAWGEAENGVEIVEHAHYAKDVDVALVWLVRDAYGCQPPPSSRAAHAIG